MIFLDDDSGRFPDLPLARTRGERLLLRTVWAAVALAAALRLLVILYDEVLR